MFIVRRKLSGNERWCVLLCESERKGSKVHQKTIKYFGVAHGKEELELLTKQAKLELKNLSTASKTRSRKNIAKDVFLKDVQEVSRITEGFVTACINLYISYNIYTNE